MNFEETIFMEDTYIKAVKRSYGGEKSRFAAIIDFICFNIFRFIAAYLLLMQGIGSRSLRILLAIVFTVILATISNIVSQNRFYKHEEQLRNDVRQGLIKRKLLCMNTDALTAQAEMLLNDICCVIQTTNALDENGLYAVLREMREKGINSFTIVSISGFGKDAERIRESTFSSSIQFKTIDDLPELKQDIKISNEEITEEILSAFRREPRKRYNFRETFYPNRTRKYLILGIILLVLSFFVRYSLYMRAASGLLFGFAGTSLIISEHRAKRETA